MQQSKPAEAAALLAGAVPGGAELSQLEVRRLTDQAALKPAEAAEYLRRASAAVSDPELAIRIKLSEAAYVLIGQASHQAFLTALAMAQRQPILYWQAAVLVNLCYSSKRLGRYEESVEFGLQALTLAEEAGARRLIAQAHGNLGSAYLYLGENELALDHEQKSVNALKVIGDRAGYMIALGELATMYDRLGDAGRAIASYQEAFQIACDLKSDRDAGRFAGNLALTLINAGQWDEAEVWNRKATGLVPSTKDNNSISYLTRNRAQIALGRGQAQEALRICEDLLRTETRDAALRWDVYHLMGMIDAGAGRFAKANREFASALQIIDSGRADLSDSHFRITLLSRLIVFYQDYVDALVTQNDDAAALRIVESSRARVMAERLERSVMPQRFADMASLRRIARSTDSALLSLWLAPKRSFAWLITSGSVRRFLLPPAGEIEKLVTRYRDVVEHAAKDPILTNDPSGPKLWDALLAEIGPQIPKKSGLIVIPDGAVHRLNLETLVVPTPKPHYWIEDVEISVAPSITIAGSKLPPSEDRDRKMLLIGAPDYTGTDFASLKYAGKEVEEIAARFGAQRASVYTGLKAVPGVYEAADPLSFAFIHFAAHADANGENPLDSAVILSRQNGQNRLYARDVIKVPIRADLVTISACRGAGVRSYAGEGLIGFAWAFLLAGAHNVVAGLWDASDSSTEPLMDQFYAGIAAGQSPPAALHQAKLGLLTGNGRFGKPYYWGPFQVYVASAARL